MIAVGYVLGGDAHGQIGPGLMLLHPLVPEAGIAAHGDGGHGLHAAGGDDLGLSGHDHVGGGGDGLEAGGAEAVDGLPGHIPAQSRPEGDHTGHIEALDALRLGAAHDQVLDLVPGQLGNFLQHAVQHLAGVIHRVGAPKSALFP